jgi:hypothetical protein
MVAGLQREEGFNNIKSGSIFKGAAITNKEIIQILKFR